MTERPAGTVDAGRRLPRPLRPFRHREYRYLAASLAASLFASGLWLVAIVWQVIDLGGGPSELSIVAAASSLGLLASALIGGVAADRLPRRALLMAVEGVRILSATAAGLLAVVGLLELWHLAVAAFVIGAAEAFFFPAYSALLPTLLPADELLAANGVEGTLRPIAQQALGPALAGVLVGAFLPGVALLLAGGMYTAALVALAAMRPLPAPAPAGGSTVLLDLGEGFAYLFRTGWLFASLAFATVYVLVITGPIEVLLPFAVRDRTGGGASGFALVLASYGVGAALGSLLVSWWRLPRRYLTAILLLWGAGAAPLAVLGLTRELWVMAVALFVVGFTGAAGMVIWGTLLQRRVPPHLLGRISSLDFFVSLALMPVSMALAGPVGERLGIPITFVLVGVVPVFLAVAAILGWRLPRDEIANPLDARPADDPAPVTTS
ncbi:MFS transporter [Pseudonocardia bannensis]|uniref:MFS transporter n=1 Tax=Pseudonocardia bannensis TaxID=630973 RepID=A0A848DHZ4_9PSEU|nr:MFS transporter [Pseudonocardia bannensis]NMH92308.1 MFS transporter [Pseudonocardia bannensis]